MLTTSGVETTLNLLGSARAEWATMHALVVQDETRVSSGTTTVRFGVPEGVETLANATGEEGGLATALLAVQPGVAGRETGSPAAVGTRGSVARVSGKDEG